MSTRTAYEVFYMNARSYGKRVVVGVFWSKEAADALATTRKPGQPYLHVGKIHLILIKGVWHRYFVTPTVIVDDSQDKQACNSSVIHTEVARRIRKRGLLLPTNAQYSDERLRTIAARQAELFAEIDALDTELFQCEN